ncbi:MAG: F0F1 ATP synthase subunit B [Phycisphaerae bacterium]
MDMHLLLAESGGGQIQDIARQFGVDWPHLGAQTISFIVVCVLLHRFAYRPVLKMLEQRRQNIADSLANAERIKAELAAAEKERQDILTSANEQAAKLIQEARAAAARVLEQETSKAMAAAKDLLAKSREDDAREHDQMLGELRREIGHLVVMTTAAVSGKVLSEEDQKRLAEESAKQVAA